MPRRRGRRRLQAASGVAADLRPLQALALLFLLRASASWTTSGPPTRSMAEMRRGRDTCGGGAERWPGLALLRRSRLGRACSAGGRLVGRGPRRQASRPAPQGRLGRGGSSGCASAATCGTSSAVVSGVASVVGSSVACASGCGRRGCGSLLRGLRRLGVARVGRSGLALGTTELAQTGEEDTAMTLGGRTTTTTTRLLAVTALAALAALASTAASATAARAA